MSQKKVYLYSPDGTEEGWYMELQAPPGWVSSRPAAEEPEEDEELRELREQVAVAEEAADVWPDDVPEAVAGQPIAEEQEEQAVRKQKKKKKK